MQRHARHVFRLGEGLVGRGAIAVLVVDREIARHVGVQHRRARRERVLRLDHRRQVAVVDRDQLGGILRGGFALRHHQRDRLADEPHAPVRERGPVRDP